jgi:hypothetical protein
MVLEQVRVKVVGHKLLTVGQSSNKHRLAWGPRRRCSASPVAPSDQSGYQARTTFAKVAGVANWQRQRSQVRRETHEGSNPSPAPILKRWLGDKRLCGGEDYLVAIVREPS